MHFIDQLSTRVKRSVALFFDFTAATLAFYFALVLKFNTFNVSTFFPSIFETTAIVVFSQVFCFIILGLYKGIWRYSSTPDLVRVIKSVSLGIVVSISIIYFHHASVRIPRTIFIIDWFMLLVFLGGGRFAYRLFRESGRINRQHTEPVLIIGAGSAGMQITREVKQNQNLNYHIVGFLDQDKTKHRRSLNGIQILGGVEKIHEVTEKYNVKKIIIAIPSASKEQMRKIFSQCNSSKIPILTLPTMNNILEGRVQFSLLRNITPEDLLGRDSVTLDLSSIGKMLEGKVVMITGAGGSIGSELCNQVAKFSPKKLILFEIGELFLFELENNLKEKFPNLKMEVVIGDVRELSRVDFVFKTFRPNIVFHAAAYKHVPMMEANPIEAIKTNIIGTKNIAEKSIEYGVQKFVQISTDKAVNPTNVMGATKRAAEIVCQDLQNISKSTQFITVRFGNVLGSNGSVIPIFKKQIEKGGPVRVTHKDMTRYFMSIPEACQLVIQAGTMGKGGEIFVLDMGQPVKILDLAKQMIQMAGYEPDIDIKIDIIGPRPGEKLFEELLASDEHSLPTDHYKVRVAKASHCKEDASLLIQKITRLTVDSSPDDLMETLGALVPGFNRAEHPQLH